MNSSSPILVLAAMPEEAAAIADLCTDLEPHPHPFSGNTNASVRVGALRGADGVSTPLVLVTTGIGTAAAAATASWAITTFSPRLVISAGSCGGLADDITVGSVVVGNAYAYSIADATAFGYEVGQVPGAPAQFTFPQMSAHVSAQIVEECRAAGLNAREGLMISGDAFVTEPLAEPMRAKFPGAISADMETTALAHTCTLHSVPFVAIRAVSDLCSPRAGEEFHVGLDVAAAHSAQAVSVGLPLLLG